MSKGGEDGGLPEAQPRWRSVFADGRRVGALATCGAGYVFYACEPELVVFDGCEFAQPAEAESVLTRAARRFGRCAPEGGDHSA